MAQKITLTCPKDHYRWELDYADLQGYRVIHRGEIGAVRKEEYHVRCPQCDTVFIKMLEIEEPQE